MLELSLAKKIVFDTKLFRNFSNAQMTEGKRLKNIQSHDCLVIAGDIDLTDERRHVLEFLGLKTNDAHLQTTHGIAVFMESLGIGWEELRQKFISNWPGKVEFTAITLRVAVLGIGSIKK